MQYQYAAGLSLIVLATIFPFVYRGKSYPEWSLSHLLVPLALIAVGLGLFDWRALLGLVAIVAFFCIWIYSFGVSEKRYERNFPVFKTAPIETIVRKDGFRHDLHIAQVRSGFIIGIKYETEVDLTPMTIETRWKDVFPDYASAKNALLHRLQEFIPLEQMPNPSIERTSPGKPGAASHVKR